MRTLAERVTNIGDNVYRAHGHSMASTAFREARIAATKRAGLYHVEVKQYRETIDWIENRGVDYTFSMDDFWFDDANVAFEVKMLFG